MQFVVTQGHITHWNRLVQLTSHLYGCPAADFFFFSSPLLCQPVSKLHIHLSDSYNLPVTHLCTPSQCASSRPWCLKFSGKNKPLCTYLNLKVPHYAKLTFTNVPHGSLPLRKRDWTPEITRNKKSPSNVSCLLKFWENVGWNTSGKEIKCDVRQATNTSKLQPTDHQFQQCWSKAFS